ncbi:hypothetical protein D9758_007727 [Tetrapyrgos nigripes]|uniref:Uncharacterized protein n=1 Tax=Tetrapyrgos nigripes TaxID=182062 RepID=A0A8H5G5D9_9AGAR|nr:hypothetical protein D9758_007727 [Tetrapyrgos nigripes]
MSSSNATPSSKPKPSKMRTMARRTSSMLSFGRSSGSQHKNDSSSETSSVRRPSIDLDASTTNESNYASNASSASNASASASSSSLTVETALPDHLKEHMLPSTIPESPAREAAATAEEAQAQAAGRVRVPRTSLSQVVTAMNEASSTSSSAPQANDAPASTERQPEPEPEQKPTQTQTVPVPVPAPVIVTDPARYTTEPDSMSLKSTKSPTQGHPDDSGSVDKPTSSSMTNQSNARPQPQLQPHGPSDTDVEPESKSNSYFDTTPRPAVEIPTFHAQSHSSPEDLKKLNEEIYKNTIREIPPEGEGEDDGRGREEGVKTAETMTPRPYGSGSVKGSAPGPAAASGPAQAQGQAAPASAPQTRALAPASTTESGSKPAHSDRAVAVQPVPPVQPAQSVPPVQPARPVQPVQPVQPVRPAPPVEVAAEVTTKETQTETETKTSVTIPEPVVMPVPVSTNDVAKKDQNAGGNGTANANDNDNDDNEDPFADPVVPIQISAQPSFQPSFEQGRGQETNNNMPQPQPTLPQAPAAFSQAPPQVLYMPLPPFQDVSGGGGGGKFRGYDTYSDHDRANGETRSLLPHPHGQEQALQGQGYGYGPGFGYGATATAAAAPGSGMTQTHHQHQHSQYPNPNHPSVPSYAYTHGLNILPTSSTLTSSSDMPTNTVTFPRLSTPSSHKSTNASTTHPRLVRLGWTAYALPNPENTVYYVHSNWKITTDVDLSRLKELDEVMRYLDLNRVGESLTGEGGDDRDGDMGTGMGTGVGVPQGFELWLIDTGLDGLSPSTGQTQTQTQSTGNGTGAGAGKGKKRKRPAKGDFNPLRCWVDHRKCLASFDPIWDARVDGVSRSVSRRGERNSMGRTDDALDMEYRYWAFIESHPAHVALAPKAHSDAIELLEWASTDQFLAPYQSQLHGVRPPFTPTECQELLKWLKAFGNKPESSSVHTRVVARIFMRVLLWRQMHLRPHKPLPEDVPRPVYLTHIAQQTHYRSQSFLRTLLDVIVSIVFMGIPYMIYTRAVYAQRMDAEYGMGGLGASLRVFGMRDAGPLMLIGGCTCLVAAIVLSASVTFLTLPGLDWISRIVGFVAIILAGFSIVSTVLALFSFKAEMERTSLYVGGEGLMVHSRRIIMLSLPLAFCIYSIVAFAAGIALYSIRGMQAQVPPGLIESHFSNYTQWTTLGVLGGLGGVIAVATAVLLG